MNELEKLRVYKAIDWQIIKQAKGWNYKAIVRRMNKLEAINGRVNELAKWWVHKAIDRGIIKRAKGRVYEAIDRRMNKLAKGASW